MPLYEPLGIIQLIETENVMVVGRGYRAAEIEHCCLMSVGFQIYKMKQFWRLVTQQCKYVYCYQSIYLEMVKMMNFMS